LKRVTSENEEVLSEAGGFGRKRNESWIVREKKAERGGEEGEEERAGE